MQLGDENINPIKILVLFFSIGKVDFFRISAFLTAFSVYNKVKFPWAVHIREAKCYKRRSHFSYYKIYSSGSVSCSSSTSSSPKLFSNAALKLSLIFFSTSSVTSGLSCKYFFTFSLPCPILSPL